MCGNGVPLAVTLTGGQRHDVTQLLPLVDKIAPIGPHGKFRPAELYADRAYDSKHHKTELRARGITPRIPRRGTTNTPAEHGSGLGTKRWPVERSFGWLHNANRRLGVRYDRRADIHEAFLTIALSQTCLSILNWPETSFR